MITINDKNICCGCTACYTVCPKKCISLIEDSEGFLYPQVNIEECIGCGLCEKACPMLQKKGIESKKTKFFVAQCKDKDIRLRSTAGGVVSIISEYAYKNGITVYGVGYEEMTVAHKRVINKSMLREISGSKYVQSQLSNTFNEINKILNEEKKVLFIGTPCQVHGLINTVGFHDNLYTIDLLCLGVSSPGLFRRWIQYLSKKYSDKVKNVEFRNKRYGYSTPNVRVYFAKRKPLEQTYDTRIHSKLFFKYYNVRPCCYECEFRECPRVSDITVGDCYDIGDINHDMDDDLGTTRVWLHNNKGATIFSEVSDKLRLYAVEDAASNVIGGKRIQITKPKDRNVFFDDSQVMDYYQFVSKWFPKSFKDFVIGVARPVFNHLPGKKFLFQYLQKKRAKSFAHKTNRV